MVFIDAGYLIAVMNRHDQHHRRAIELARLAETAITTEWVLGEVLAYAAGSPLRGVACRLVDHLEQQARVEILPASSAQFQIGLALYRDRPDKAWSLVDCISFETMRRRAIGEALSADHHFEQAGFRALLRG